MKYRYREVELYDEVVSWRAILRISEMITGVDSEGCVSNIFKEPLSYLLFWYVLGIDPECRIYAVLIIINARYLFSAETFNYCCQ